MEWEEVVGIAEQVFCAVVEEEDVAFIICPECGEPIYEQDYRGDGLCPACEFDFSEV